MLPRRREPAAKVVCAPDSEHQAKGPDKAKPGSPKKVVRKAVASVGQSGGKGCQAGLKWGSWALSREDLRVQTMNPHQNAWFWF